MTMTDTEYEKIYEQYHGKVFSYVKARISNFHDAEDITSDVFVKVMTAYENYDSQKASLSTWIYTIAANTVKDHVRRMAVRERSNCDTSEEYFETLAAEEDSAFDDICREEALQILANALECLTDRERMIVIMHYYKNVPHKEIADHLGLSYPNVRFITHKALEKIRIFLGNNGYY